MTLKQFENHHFKIFDLVIIPNNKEPVEFMGIDYNSRKILTKTIDSDEFVKWIGYMHVELYND